MTEWIVSSAVLIVVITLVRQLLKGKISLRLQYALWALVLIRLLVPVSFGSTRISVGNAVTEQQTVQTEITVDIPPSRVDYVAPDLAIPEPDPALPEDEWQEQYEENVQQWQEEQDAAWEEYKAENTRHVTVSVTDVLRMVWMAGVAATVILFGLSNLRFALRLRRSRQAVEADCKLPVYVSGAVETPCLFGLIRPAVYVTPEVAQNPDVMRHVLAHELTHYRHWDHIWSVLRCVCLALHWYNPLVWLAASLSRRDAELACDESTIRRIGEEERTAYGRTLVGLTCAHRSNLLHTATTMTGSKKSIKERIILIAKKPKMAVYTLVAVLLIAAVAVGCTFTGAEKPEDTDVEALFAAQTETKSWEIIASVEFADLAYEDTHEMVGAVLYRDSESNTGGVAFVEENGYWSLGLSAQPYVDSAVVYEGAGTVLFYLQTGDGEPYECRVTLSFSETGVVQLRSESALDPSTQPDTELTSEIEQMIEQAYIEMKKQGWGENPDLEQLGIETYYGRYGDVYVVLMEEPIHLTVAWTETVGGVEFYHPDHRTILVYNGAEFCTLAEAFDQGLLTHADLEQIAEIHRTGGDSGTDTEPTPDPAVPFTVTFVRSSPSEDHITQFILEYGEKTIEFSGNHLDVPFEVGPMYTYFFDMTGDGQEELVVFLAPGIGTNGVKHEIHIFDGVTLEEYDTSNFWSLAHTPYTFTAQGDTYYVLAGDELLGSFTKADVLDHWSNYPGYSDFTPADNIYLREECVYASVQDGRLCVSAECMVGDEWQYYGQVTTQLTLVDGILSVAQTSYTPPASSDTETSELEQCIEISRWEYGYPKVIDERWMDTDGDQSEERVTLLREWGPIFNEANEPCYESELYHYPLIRVEKDGQSFEYRWETASYGSHLDSMTDTLGRTVLIVTMETGGSGAGTLEIAALTFDGENLLALGVPCYETSGLTFCGFEATAAYRDGFKLEIGVAATGSTQELSLGDYPTNDEAETSPYDADGSCLFTASCGVDSVSNYEVGQKDGEPILRLYQYVYGSAGHGEGLGWLVSEITWTESGFAVVGQSVVPLFD